MVAFDIHANYGAERSILQGLSWIGRKRFFIFSPVVWILSGKITPQID